MGDADKDREVIKVAVVTGVRSDQNQLQDLLRRIVSAVERPTPTPEMSDIKKLLLQLTRVPQDGPAPVVDTPVPQTLEQILRFVLDGQRRRERQPQRQRQPPKQRPVRRDWSDVICFSCVKTGHTATRCPDYNEFASIPATWMAEGKDAEGFHYDSSTGGNGPSTSGKRRLIRGGGGGGPGWSGCYYWPCWPVCRRGPGCPAHCLPALKSCKHLIPDHADPVVQHDAESDTAELLEYEVVENILDGRPTKGIRRSF